MLEFPCIGSNVVDVSATVLSFSCILKVALAPHSENVIESRVEVLCSVLDVVCSLELDELRMFGVRSVDIQRL